MAGLARSDSLHDQTRFQAEPAGSQQGRDSARRRTARKFPGMDRYNGLDYPRRSGAELLGVSTPGKNVKEKG